MMPCEHTLPHLPAVSSSEGFVPSHHDVRMMPRLHTSTGGPKYIDPSKTSGAAWAGLPQNVFSSSPGWYSVLRLKSAVFTLGQQQGASCSVSGPGARSPARGRGSGPMGAAGRGAGPPPRSCGPAHPGRGECLPRACSP